MRGAYEIADWWDEQRKKNDKSVERFIDANPNALGIIVGGTNLTAMQILDGVFDMARFGQGAAEGGLSGFGKDAIRLVGLAGPAGRVAGAGVSAAATVVRNANRIRLAKLVVDPGGGRCAWIAGTMALRQTGHAFASVDDLARALGYHTLDQLPKLYRLKPLLDHLRKLGATAGPSVKVSRFDEIVEMTPRDGSVTVFTVRVTRWPLLPGGGRIKERVGHAVYAFRDSFGKVKIMDRGGAEYPKPYDLVQAMKKKYGGSEVVFDEAAVIQNVFPKYVVEMNRYVLTLAVFALAGIDFVEHETFAQAYEVRSRISGTGWLETQTHTTSQGETLPSIASSYYHDEKRWPVLFEANRNVLGGDPSAVTEGQELVVPTLPIVRGIRRSPGFALA